MIKMVKRKMVIAGYLKSAAIYDMIKE